MTKEEFTAYVIQTRNESEETMIKALGELIDGLDDMTAGVREHDPAMADIIDKWVANLRESSLSTCRVLKFYASAHYNAEGNKL